MKELRYAQLFRHTLHKGNQTDWQNGRIMLAWDNVYTGTRIQTCTHKCTDTRFSFSKKSNYFVPALILIDMVIVHMRSELTASFSSGPSMGNIEAETLRKHMHT